MIARAQKVRTVERGTRAQMREVQAFTLIELLVVISVIAILAGLILPVSGAISRKYKMSRVTAELNQLVTAIEAYKFQLGSYPPDNVKVATTYVTDGTDPKDPKANKEYLYYAALNPLYYELMGARFTNKSFVVENVLVDPSDLDYYFGYKGVQNSARDRSDIPYKGYQIRGAQHKEIRRGGKGQIQLLTVPVQGTKEMEYTFKSKGLAPVNGFNPWYYDSSSTNRHNSRTYDVWAEIVVGRRTNIIGNWKE